MPASDPFQRICDSFETLAEGISSIILSEKISRDDRLAAIAIAQSIGYAFITVGEAMESGSKDRFKQAMDEAEELAKKAQAVVDKYPHS